MTNRVNAPAAEAIAIIGMSGRFPGAASLEAFWHNLRSGLDCLTEFSDAELEAAGIDDKLRAQPNWVPRGTILEGADRFDASLFGYSPREAQIIDPQQRMFLECAWAALDDAGYGGDLNGKAVGVYAGASMNTYFLSQLLSNRALLESVGGYQLMIGNDKDFLCTRASYKLNLQGPSMTVQTACSTSLVAVQLACRALQRGECEMALAGGVSITFPQRTGYPYQEGMIFSPDGVCRPFDADARGTRAGAGAGIVVLKRLSDALADRDSIGAVILGAAVNNDGSGKVGYTAPSVDGQMEAIVTAQALGDVDPRSISYLEAHGTATPLGDPIEIAALTRVFRAATSDREFCALGSLKANLGHLDAAAGVAGLIKTVLALRHREIPPLAHFRSPNPELALDTSPFRVPRELEPWTSDGPRRAGVSSFGIGGTNAHVVLEEAPPAAASISHRSHQLLVLSARTSEALDAATANLATHWRAHPELVLADVASTLQSGRRLLTHRRSVVVHDAAEAIRLLEAPEKMPVLTGTHEGSARPVAFMFSGQGSQHAGMTRQLYDTEPVFRDAFDRCAELLAPMIDGDLRVILRDGSDAQLAETRLTQPLLFATEYALATLWMAWGVQPRAMIGHSIGEYVAAHLAGVFSLPDALTLVAARGRLMHALPAGAMMAVGLPAAELRGRLRAGVEIAAVNAPALCSVSGSTPAIEALDRELTDAGIEHRMLHTSHAFHSAMMEPALAPFRDIVAGISLAVPSKRYVSNVTGTWILPEQATSPEYYVAHLRGSVRFAEGVAALAEDPSLLLLEVGPGNALSTLARLALGREGAQRVVSSQPHPREARAQAETLLTAAARLWLAGVPISWDGMHRDERLRRVPLPAYPFERQRHWVDASPRSIEAPAESYRREDPTEWYHVPTWIRADVVASRRLPVVGSWIVFGENDPLTEEVCVRLRAQGASVAVVRKGRSFAADDEEKFELRPDSDADYRALFDALRGRSIDGIVHLWNVGSLEAEAEDDATLPLHAVMALGRALIVERPSATVRLIIATSGAQSVLREAVTAPVRSLVTGPVLVLPVEHEALRVSAIDLDPSSLGLPGAATALLDEVASDDREAFIAQRAGLRWARRYAEQSLPAWDERTLPLKPNGVYLITGGTGGIGLTLGAWLAERASARLALTCRRSLPPRGEWQSWLAEHPSDDANTEIMRGVERIEAAGGEVLLLTADMNDEAALRRAHAEVLSRWGTIDGVIHSAGVAGGSAVAFAQPAETEAVLAAKLQGTRTLARIFQETPLDFFVVFSSISAVIGAAGGCAYAAACAYLDAFVLSSQRSSRWRASLSMAWDAWRDVGMAERVVVPAAHRAARKAYVAAGISPERGADAFGRALSAGESQLVISPFEVARILKLVRQRGAERAATPAPAAQPSPAPSAAFDRKGKPLAAPASETEKKLAIIWEELLGVQPIGIDDDFFELGGHSLLATRILARVDELFGLRLPLRIVFDAPTIRQLAEQLNGGRPADPERSGEREEFEL